MANLIKRMAVGTWTGDVDDMNLMRRYETIEDSHYTETIDADHYVSNLVLDLQRGAADEEIELDADALKKYTATLYAAVEKHNAYAAERAAEK